MQAHDLVVLWRVYEHCNLGCHFCGYSKHLSRPRAVADLETVLSFGEVLSDYGRRYGRRIHVSWLGGEPLLWPELAGLARVYRRALGLGQGVTTNGTPLRSPTVRAALVEDFEQITISVDGLGAYHDTCRDAPGLFDRLRDGVRALRAEVDAAGSGLLIKANTILMRGNVEAFEALGRELANWGVRELTFNQLGGNDRPEYYPANRLLPEQAERFAAELPAVRERLAGLGLVVHGGEGYLRRITATSRGERLPIEDCGPGAWFLFIDERGRVAPCSFTAAQYGVPLKDLLNAETLRGLPAVFVERRRAQRAAPCEDCHSTQVFEKFDVSGEARRRPRALRNEGSG